MVELELLVGVSPVFSWLGSPGGGCKTFCIELVVLDGSSGASVGASCVCVCVCESVCVCVCVCLHANRYNLSMSG